MRINIVSGPFYPCPPAPTGAVQRIWFDLAKAFVARGHEVRVQSCGFPGFPKNQIVDGVQIKRIFRLKQTLSNKVNLAKDMLYSLRVLLILPAADVTVTNCFWLPAMISRLPWRKRWGKIVVSIARVPKGQIKLYRRCDRLHAVSTAIARWTVEECPAAASITRAIGNPIDTEQFNIRRGFPQSPDDRPTIIYTGRVHPEKGLDILIRALRLVQQTNPNVRLRIIGPSSTERRRRGPQFVSQLKQLAGDADVTFEPPIYSRTELADALRTGDIYCYPSTAEKGEASPVAPLEAMGVGLVPVCSDLPQYCDYLDDGENGLIFNHRGDEGPQVAGSGISKITKRARLPAKAGRERCRHRRGLFQCRRG